MLLSFVAFLFSVLQSFFGRFEHYGGQNAVYTATKIEISVFDRMRGGYKTFRFAGNVPESNVKCCERGSSRCASLRGRPKVEFERKGAGS